MMEASLVPPSPERSALGWHPGERAIMELLGVTTFQRPNPTSLVFPPAHGARISENELLAVGTLDHEGRPWSTIWGGQKGFAQQIAKGILGVRVLVDRQHDPVVQALLSPANSPDDDYKLMSGISIDFDSRDRVKVMGRLLGIEPLDDMDMADHNKLVGDLQLSMLVQESTGNCPKYINRREVRTHVPSPQLMSESLPLPPQAVSLIHKTDLFFVSSTNGESMDTNHRGGPSGFMRVASNEPKDCRGVVLVYPEYSGNRLYQSLGNLYLNPRIGIVVPDFESSDVLYLTGTADLLLGAAAAEIMPHCKLAVRIHVQAARLVANGLPFCGSPVHDMSPYDPPVRGLAQEPNVLSETTSSAAATAELVNRELLTPSINRFTFALHPPAHSTSSTTTTPQGGSSMIAVKPWAAGQHVTLDFSGELDKGYKHMNAENPQSLNDDYVRTFTVTNLPPAASETEGEENTLPEGTLMQLTVRKHGAVTAFLWDYDMKTTKLKIPLMGFGGDEAFQLLPIAAQKPCEEQAVFIAGGVGVTPLLAQAPGVLAGPGQESQDYLHVLWTLRADDLPLAIDTFSKIPGLAVRTRLFVTGVNLADRTHSSVEEETLKSLLDQVAAVGAEVVHRRIDKGDVLKPVQEVSEAGRKTKFFICTSTELSKTLLVWLGGQTVVSENFSY
ncbi:uncharacterized protein BHQ10_002844 [Talaromyces amestolkiae]|uniref:FAD-binding FR-type domain-containing protein n=1 Tax=Talaromyces amestolkiae TaxID=1196081 RepID=A0A364KTF7_TALAM|nr:uncharacterized protein BHQ10_002844 [Talaromyces amestolkiae]RAO66832.1 hypothetical protein BHQ10_002844 [Talaromyces amestolkiae]